MTKENAKKRATWRGRLSNREASKTYTHQTLSLTHYLTPKPINLPPAWKETKQSLQGGVQKPREEKIHTKRT